MSETPQTEVGCWVELWVLMLSKKRVVCGYLSMETLLFKFNFSVSFFSFAVWLAVHGSASGCSFLCNWVQVCLPAPVSQDLWQLSLWTHMYEPRGLLYGWERDQHVSWLRAEEEMSVGHCICLKFWIPVLITKLPNFLKNSSWTEWKPNISICVLASFSHQKIIHCVVTQDRKQTQTRNVPRLMVKAILP